MTAPNNSETALKPCPFCGGEANVHIVRHEQPLYKRYSVAEVYCMVCLVAKLEKWGDTDEEAIERAIEAWNTRAERTARNADKYADAGFFICGNCGFGDGGIEITPNYCPNCGAKVVEE